MGIRSIVLEQGKYKTLTNEICSDIIALIKRTKSRKFYKNTQVRFDPAEERPAFHEQDSHIRLGVYTSLQLDMVFAVYLKINRDFGETRILVDGYADEGVVTADGDIETIPSIEVNIAFPGENEEQHYTEIMAWLKDVVRHEIEHLTQRGINAKPGKHRNLNFSRRAVIAGTPEMYYKYYLLADEIEPNLHGLYTMARYKRQSLSTTISSYLDFLTTTGTIQEPHKKTILSKWRTVGKRLNLPKF